MKSDKLAEYVEDQIVRVYDRILGVGQEQYGQEEDQLFETMPLDKLFEFAREELDDIIVYAVMLKIRLDRMEAVLDDRIENWDAGRTIK
jgi:hypothetical protein